MRITNSMMMDTMITNLNVGLGRMNDYNAQLSSNRRIITLSADPVGVLNSLNARQRITKLAQYQDNLVSSRSWVDQTESAIRDIHSIIVSLQENVIDAGGAKNDDDKTNIYEIVSSMKDQVLDIANSSIGGRYLFAGYNSTMPPFKAVGDKVLYNGIDLGVAAYQPEQGALNGLALGVSVGNMPTSQNISFSAAGESLVVTDTITGTAITVPAFEFQKGNVALDGLGGGFAGAKLSFSPSAFSDVNTFLNGNAAISVSSDALGATSWSAPPAQGVSWRGMTSTDTFSMVPNGANVEIKNSNGDVVKTLKDADIAAANGKLDLTDIGLGVIEFNKDALTTAKSLLSGGAPLNGIKADTTKYDTFDEEKQKIHFEVGFGITMDITFTGVELAGVGEDNIFSIIDNVCDKLKNGASTEELGKLITPLAKLQDRLMAMAVQTGARSVKIETLENRYDGDMINYEEVRASVEDIDQSRTIMQYKLAESIYKQALSVGARVIMPTLLDFLR